MSTQSIIHKSTSDLLDDVDNLYMCLATKYIVKRKFGIGCEPNREDIYKIMWLDRILCENDCLLEKYIPKVKETLNTLLINNKQ